MISLGELATWEAHLQSRVTAASGTLDERDRRLEQAGVYADYAAIFSAYVEIVTLAPDEAEALKRAVFLSWYAMVQPSALSGIGELPEGQVRTVWAALAERARRGGVDEEFWAMLGWYHHLFDYPFSMYAELRGLDEAVRARLEATGATWPRVAEHPGGRGAMGRFFAPEHAP